MPPNAGAKFKCDEVPRRYQPARVRTFHAVGTNPMPRTTWALLLPWLVLGGCRSPAPPPPPPAGPPAPVATQNRPLPPPAPVYRGPPQGPYLPAAPPAPLDRGAPQTPPPRPAPPPQGAWGVPAACPPPAKQGLLERLGLWQDDDCRPKTQKEIDDDFKWRNNG
jgi:hypothetical protein